MYKAVDLLPYDCVCVCVCVCVVQVKCAAGGGLCFGRSLESDTLTAPYQCSSSGHTFTLPR